MIIAAIVAGGSGTRMGGELPKQFIDLCGKPVIIRTIESFLGHSRVDAAVVGINPAYYDYMKELAARYLPGERVFITNGGASRNETIENIISYSLSELGCSDSDIILSHDAVRPFVSKKLIDSSIAATEGCVICTAAVPEVDTVAVSEDGFTVESFPDRSRLYRIQTPQTFRAGRFTEIFGSLSAEEKQKATDVCSLFLLRGYKTAIVQGDYTNIKLTYPEDLMIAKSILNPV